jgi:hypothetical protein
MAVRISRSRSPAGPDGMSISSLEPEALPKYFRCRGLECGCKAPFAILGSPVEGVKEGGGLAVQTGSSAPARGKMGKDVSEGVPYPYSLSLAIAVGD